MFSDPYNTACFILHVPRLAPPRPAPQLILQNRKARPAGSLAQMPRQSQARVARAAQLELDRAVGILEGRAARILRIQTLYYPEFLGRHPVSSLPVPPFVVGRRREWERAYRAWRDAVLLGLRDSD